VLPGEKAKLVNFIDDVQSGLQTLYSVEVALMKSPKKGVKCGAIAIFKLNDTGLDLNASPEQVAAMEKEVREQTEVMYRDPEYFKHSEGRWIAWAVNRALTIFDDLGTNADISIKCPKLRICQKIPRADVLAGRADVKKLFWTAWEIDRLLDKNYKYDPWTKSIRRGRIGADMGKR
jgi:hypothetical protein